MGLMASFYDLLNCYKVHYYLIFQPFVGPSWLILIYRRGCVKLVFDRPCNFSLLLNPLQVRPGWRGASTEPQSVQFQAETPRPGGGRGWGGGWRRGGRGRQPDREVSRWGSGVPVTHHSGSVWGGWGGGRDRDGSLSYELRTHSQVLIAFVNTQTINTDGQHEASPCSTPPCESQHWILHSIHCCTEWAVISSVAARWHHLPKVLFV